MGVFFIFNQVGNSKTSSTTEFTLRAFEGITSDLLFWGYPYQKLDKLTIREKSMIWADKANKEYKANWSPTDSKGKKQTYKPLIEYKK